MSQDAHVGFEARPDRQEAFRQIARLLQAGEAPRTHEGALDWWLAAGSFLAHNRPGEPKQKTPRREEGYALFRKEMLYRLPTPSIEDLAGYPSRVEQFAAEAAHMPESMAAPTLDRLDKMGLLSLRPADEADPVAARILWAMLGAGVSDKAFDIVARAALHDPARDQELLRRAVDDGEAVAVQRLLRMGADPTEGNLMQLARDSAPPGIYDLLVKAAARQTDRPKPK